MENLLNRKFIIFLNNYIMRLNWVHYPFSFGQEITVFHNFNASIVVIWHLNAAEDLKTESLNLQIISKVQAQRG